jgi:hypothetical protein
MSEKHPSYDDVLDMSSLPLADNAPRGRGDRERGGRGRQPGEGPTRPSGGPSFNIDAYVDEEAGKPARLAGRDDFGDDEENTPQSGFGRGRNAGDAGPSTSGRGGRDGRTDRGEGADDSFAAPRGQGQRSRGESRRDFYGEGFPEGGDRLRGRSPRGGAHNAIMPGERGRDPFQEGRRPPPAGPVTRVIERHAPFAVPVPMGPPPFPQYRYHELDLVDVNRLAMAAGVPKRFVYDLHVQGLIFCDYAIEMYITSIYVSPDPRVRLFMERLMQSGLCLSSRAAVEDWQDGYLLDEVF